MNLEDKIKSIRMTREELICDEAFIRKYDYMTGVVDGLDVALKILEKDEENDGRYEQGDSKETKA